MMLFQNRFRSLTPGSFRMTISGANYLLIFLFCSFSLLNTEGQKIPLHFECSYGSSLPLGQETAEVYDFSHNLAGKVKISLLNGKTETGLKIDEDVFINRYTDGGMEILSLSSLSLMLDYRISLDKANSLTLYPFLSGGYSLAGVYRGSDWDFNNRMKGRDRTYSIGMGLAFEKYFIEAQYRIFEPVIILDQDYYDFYESPFGLYQLFDIQEFSLDFSRINLSFGIRF